MGIGGVFGGGPAAPTGPVICPIERARLRISCWRLRRSSGSCSSSGGDPNGSSGSPSKSHGF